MAVICADGCAEEYLTLGFIHGELPHLAKLAADGHCGLARGALPSFTNVNNCAMVTGTPPSQTGIGGNYILDPDTGEEVMTNSSRFLRNETILAADRRQAVRQRWSPPRKAARTALQGHGRHRCLRREGR
ncbi:MAG: hypothetical protein CM1200mP29_16200 [Verrucomicrobiota bacterium]|nr:MAG: hypothetical protein CM1200mP29_16200 [Verrucomicrobiota bacterium]